MAITTLAGTRWRFPSPDIQCDQSITSDFYEITFESNGQNFVAIDYSVENGLVSQLTYMIDGTSLVDAYTNTDTPPWQDEKYRTIKITGGADAEDQTLIQFLEQVATNITEDKQMQFTQVPSDLLEKLQLNAGILCEEFNPATGAVTNLIGATTGGFSFEDTPNYEDFGDDVDNCPKNTLELKRITSRDVKGSGTLLTVTAALTKKLIGAADVASTKITPRDTLTADDFTDLWWVGDYGDKNTGAANAGYVAIHLMNVLNTGGFRIQTSDKAKGQFPFEFTAHYSVESIDTVPYEVYVKAGSTQT